MKFNLDVKRRHRRPIVKVFLSSLYGTMANNLKKYDAYIERNITNEN